MADQGFELRCGFMVHRLLPCTPGKPVLPEKKKKGGKKEEEDEEGNSE
jgi:hypothetical protein